MEEVEEFKDLEAILSKYRSMEREVKQGAEKERQTIDSVVTIRRGNHEGKERTMI